MKMPDSVYNIFKWVCLIAVPAFNTLLITLTNLWGWNIPIDAIVGTLSAITAFIGVLIGISTSQYNKTK